VQDASSPLPSTREELDPFVDRFEAHFISQQHNHGLGAEKLTMFERAILAAFIAWLRDHAGDKYGHHQAG